MSKGKRSFILTQLSLFRFHQWTKNLLLFVPVLLAHELDKVSLTQSSFIFLSFSMVASGVYIFNDLIDRNSDRAHSVKRHRPIASGVVSFRRAILIGIANIALGLILGGLLGLDYLAVVITYLSLSTIYSLWLKSVLALDMVALSGMYILRLYAGAIAFSVAVSGWLLIFSLFFFFSVASIKRFIELQNEKFTNNSRPYRQEDRIFISLFGVTAGIVSILVLMFYFQSPTVEVHYKNPFWLWLVAPMLFFWLNRIWLLANRGLVDSDPIIFAIKDPLSWATGLGMVALVMWAV